MVSDDAAPLNSLVQRFGKRTEAQCGIAVFRTLIEAWFKMAIPA
jgi:hypothetical protein